MTTNRTKVSAFSGAHWPGDAEGRGAVVADSLREKLIKIGAKVVSHGRYVTFQMAEVDTAVRRVKLGL